MKIPPKPETLARHFKGPTMTVRGPNLLDLCWSQKGRRYPRYIFWLQPIPARTGVWFPTVGRLRRPGGKLETVTFQEADVFRGLRDLLVSQLDQLDDSQKATLTAFLIKRRAT